MCLLKIQPIEDIDVNCGLGFLIYMLLVFIFKLNKHSIIIINPISQIKLLFSIIIDKNKWRRHINSKKILQILRMF
jgi:hypothetical protein